MDAAEGEASEPASESAADAAGERPKRRRGRRGGRGRRRPAARAGAAPDEPASAEAPAPARAPAPERREPRRAPARAPAPAPAEETDFGADLDEPRPSREEPSGDEPSADADASPEAGADGAAPRRRRRRGGRGRRRTTKPAEGDAAPAPSPEPAPDLPASFDEPPPPAPAPVPDLATQMHDDWELAERELREQRGELPAAPPRPERHREERSERPVREERPFREERPVRDEGPGPSRVGSRLRAPRRDRVDRGPPPPAQPQAEPTPMADRRPRAPQPEHRSGVQDWFSPERLEACQHAIGYHFRDISLLENALTHSSIKAHDRPSYERMEFLGDSVVGLVIAEYLYNLLPDCDEGDLTKVKSMVVSTDGLADAAKACGLDRFLAVGRGILMKDAVPRSLIADVFEGVVGAVYLDRGYETVRLYVLDLLRPHIEEALSDRGQNNFKSVLQQVAQRDFGETPYYDVLRESGPDHSRVFEVLAVVGKRRFGIARAPTKKEAEQAAAKLALQTILLEKSSRKSGGGRRPRRR